VRPDDDVQPAVGQFLECLADFPGGLETRQFGDSDRPVGEAVAESLEVLFAEQGGRAQDRHLPAASHCAEGGAQGDFGLAEADVTADQTVHRPAGFHVFDDCGDRGCLILCLFKTETVGEGVVVMCLELAGVALPCCPQGVEGEQFRGRVACLQRGTALGLLPLLRTEGVQGGGVGIGTRVARDDMQLRYRYIELGVAGVMQFEELHLAFAQVKVEQALIASDAMLFMHHRRPDLQFGEVTQPVVHRSLALRQVARAP
jgi:hypothetical protein